MMMCSQPVPYICPADKSYLRFADAQVVGANVKSGFLESEAGLRYPIDDGIVDFVGPSKLTGGDAASVEEYDRTASVYDQNLPITFDTVCQNEGEGRRHIISRLNVKQGSTVLEVGCGTGRDTLLIAEQMNGFGKLHAQDLSLPILKKCKEKFQHSEVQVEFARANASSIPLPDACCDAVFHFGGLNTFTDIPAALAEMCRVTREGGRVVVGDEGVAPWMRHSILGRVLMHNNPLYGHLPPFAHISEEARNVSVEWVFAGTFYIIVFDVSKRALEFDLDIPIPGKRGGTNRTRYAGQLEGVTQETKSLAASACAASGKSMHDWLDSVVRAAAERELARSGRRERYSA
jgi:ubiquinone/menaquinone biosynthesis C-methylase UbiE